MGWNFGDMLDGIAASIPQDTPALVHGTGDQKRLITWGDFDRRSNNLARAMIAQGAVPGDKVAFYLRNGPAYAETMSACFKARLTHVNVNYRYTPDEVLYIIDNSDAVAVVFDAVFAPAVEAIQSRLTKAKILIMAGGQATGPFQDYETIVTTGAGARLDIKRSPDDEFFIYTGGTTGMPKGVIWRHTDLREIQLAPMRLLGPVPENLPDFLSAMKALGPSGRLIPACPMMHGTGLLSALGTMLSGGMIATLTGTGLDVGEIWAATHEHRIERIAIVGDAFAKPMLTMLDQDPKRFDLSCVIAIVSSGTMWSTEVKRGLLRHMPQAQMIDNFGSSEGIGFGASVMMAGAEIETARFTMGTRCKVFDQNDLEVQPGSGIPGIVAVREPVPIGYYKDPEKSQRTFRVINGVRYSMPGDWCLVEPDGTLTLLGRGSACINTAGEKVFPEEVEEALKTHPSVEDALVVGVPDDRWGQAVMATITLNKGQDFDEGKLRDHVRGQLAGYKTPKRIFAGPVAFRAPNGKADYKQATAYIKGQLGAG
jgi:fatty-acyl-CoA synthase